MNCVSMQGEGSSSISRVGLQRYDRDNLAPRIIVTINLFEKRLGNWKNNKTYLQFLCVRIAGQSAH